MGFKLTRRGVGEVKAGKLALVYFPYTGISSFPSIVSSCDCSHVEIDTTNSRLIVKYTPRFPRHITEQKFDTNKTINVTYLDGEDKEHSVVLSFYGTILK